MFFCVLRYSACRYSLLTYLTLETLVPEDHRDKIRLRKSDKIYCGYLPEMVNSTKLERNCR